MLPRESRRNELRRQFEMYHGQLHDNALYRNLNWYYCHNAQRPIELCEWFMLGDISVEDIEKLRFLLLPGELISLGWKDMAPDVRDDEFGNGGGLWLVISRDGVVYDKMDESRGVKRQ